MAAYADVAPVDLHLDLGHLVHLLGGTSQGRGQQKHPERAPREGMHRQPRLGQERPQLIGPPVLADGVEAAVQDAVAGLKLGQQPL